MKFISPPVSEGLFVLIKSLKKSEKRSFKLFINKQTKIKEISTYTKLFDTIDKQEIYNEQAIIQKLCFAQRKLACTKHLLYELILKSLRYLHSEQNTDFKLRALLDKVEILYNRALYLQSHKMLTKAKKIATNEEKYTYMPEIMRWAKKLFSHTRQGFRSGDASTFFEDCRKITTKVNQELGLTELLNSIKLIKQYSYTCSTSQEKTQLDKIITHPLLTISPEGFTFKGQLAYYEIHSLYYYLLKNNHQAYFYYQKLMTLWENNPIRASDFSEEYRQSIFDFLMMALITQQSLEYPVWFEKLHKIPAKHAQEETLSMTLYTTLELSYNLYQNSSIEPEHIIEKESTQYLLNLDTTSQCLLAYHASFNCFLQGTSQKALSSINCLLGSVCKTLPLKQQGFIRILELILHYELDNLDFIDHLYRSIYRFLHKTTTDTSFEFMVIKHIRKLYNASDKAGKYYILQAFEQTLTGIPWQKVPWQIHEYNVLLAWIRSKLSHGKALEEFRLMSEGELVAEA